ncbi:MAG: hypothetical protein PHP00_00565 [Thiotrichaceae bacterium]|nr:hypothetical protein [Thiotrichaceae bacterium]
MKMNKTLLGLAIATALGSASINALAVPAIGVVIGGSASTQKPVYFAKERNAETAGVFLNAAAGVVAPALGVGGDLNVTFPTQPSYLVNATNTMFVKVTLAKGAKFGGTNNPVLMCKGLSGAAAATVSANFQVGGKGTSSVSFSLPLGFTTTATSGLCTLVASSYVGVPAAGLTVSALVRYKDGVTQLSAGHNGTVISFATGTQLRVSTASSQVTANVGLESKLFTTGTKISSATPTASASPKTAYLGFVKYGMFYQSSTDIHVTRYAGTAALYEPVAASVAVSTANLVLEGAALAAGTSIKLMTGAAGCAATMYKSATLAGTNSVTIAGVAANVLSAGFSVCLIVDGTKAIDQGTITASLTGTAKSNFTPVFTPYNGANSLATIKQNGTTVRLLNLPAPTGAEKAFVRLYNPNTQPIKVTGSLYTADGKAVGTSQVVNAALPGFSVQVLDAPALVTLFGTWTGKATLRLDANADKFKAMGTIRDLTGTLINASGSTKD